MQGKNRLYEQKFFQNVARDTADKLWAAGSIREFPAGHVLMRAKDCTSQVYITDWVYSSTGEIYSGGQTVTVPAPLEIIPVFIRKGSGVEVY